ncbi:MAG TPA: AMP-binding protein [Planctomycetota bacterium]|jgi:acyl-CoA synthetase (AMP-forming)/AMP-acid ligase II|nr:AMP-binding protein [Planctomycetota bacterium]
MDLSSILERAVLLHGREPSVFCGNLAWTYADLEREALALARGFAAAGLRRGDRVAILHRNCHRFLKAAFAAVLGGEVLVPLNVRLDAAALGEQLADSDARLLLVEERFRELAAAAAEKAGGGVRVADAEAVRADGARGVPVSASPDDLAQIYYTSGTTGRPRGAMLLHRNVASHALMAIAELGLTDADAWAHVAPMFHLADAWAVFAITWVAGRHVMFADFEPPAVLEGLRSRGVTITNLVPTMLSRLVAQPAAGEGSFPALRAILSGGAPIAPALVDRVVETFRVPYVQTYGLTETSPYLTFSLPKRTMRGRPAEEQRRSAARTGRPAIGVRLRLVDESGRDVPRDDRSVGEVWVRSPWVTPGYWNRPDETAAAFQDGWFKTGDLATWDEEGSIQIVDRKKDVILTGAEKVFSVEVEAALAAHPAVLECAVVGAPDPDWGEAVAAAVVLRPGAQAGEKDLEAFLRDRLASFKVPKRFAFVPELPKTGSGKIRKSEVRRAFGGSRP